MANKLSADAVAAYERDGFYFPIRALSEADIGALYGKLQAFSQAHPDEARIALRNKTHLLFPWLYDLVRNDAILDAVEPILGPDILCWGTGFFSKQAHDPSYVTWHQDSTYWGLEPFDIVTAWVAFTPSKRMNGCMRVVPGSHLMGQLDHADTFDSHNLLSRGQEIAVKVDEDQAVDIELEPGEISLHHVRIVHGSEANPSDVPRIGFTIRYIPTYVRQTGPRTTALLARGEDKYNHFDPEPRPKGDYHPEAVAFHRQVVENLNSILYDGAAKRPAAE